MGHSTYFVEDRVLNDKSFWVWKEGIAGKQILKCGGGRCLYSEMLGRVKYNGVQRKEEEVGQEASGS